MTWTAQNIQNVFWTPSNRFDPPPYFGGVSDTLLELVGVMANSINTSALAAVAVWIM